MTEEKAIELIKSWICNAKCISTPCDDSCMYGNDKCAFGIAIDALEKQINDKRVNKHE